jgi:hypothetical protein
MLLLLRTAPSRPITRTPLLPTSFLPVNSTRFYPANILTASVTPALLATRQQRNVNFRSNKYIPILLLAHKRRVLRKLYYWFDANRAFDYFNSYECLTI